VSTALVVVEASAVVSSTASRLPRADFLAHLIAISTQAPQTRMRRRAEPAEAATVYGSAEQGARAERPTLFCSL
jgi:hypothetical protein